MGPSSLVDSKCRHVISFIFSTALICIFFLLIRQLSTSLKHNNPTPPKFSTSGRNFHVFCQQLNGRPDTVWLKKGQISARGFIYCYHSRNTILSVNCKSVWAKQGRCFCNFLASLNQPSLVSKRLSVIWGKCLTVVQCNINPKDALPKESVNTYLGSDLAVGVVVDALPGSNNLQGAFKSDAVRWRTTTSFYSLLLHVSTDHPITNQTSSLWQLQCNYQGCATLQILKHGINTRQSVTIL